jgi:hypothetical protein
VLIAIGIRIGLDVQDGMASLDRVSGKFHDRAARGVRPICEVDLALPALTEKFVLCNDPDLIQTFLKSKSQKQTVFNNQQIFVAAHINRAVVQESACNVFTFTYTPAILG